jgi:hypothetical protein
MRYVSLGARFIYDDSEESCIPSARPAPDRSRQDSFPYAAALRRELIARNRIYAERHHLPSRETYGAEPTICYLPCERELLHGNFLPQTYRAIQKSDCWRMRLEKSHTSARRALPREDRRWRELDSCISSDALLMNFFCYPGMLYEKRALAILGVNAEAKPQFGIKARVPLANGRVDRTEVDMKLGSLLVEAKLTESDFQKKSAPVVEAYLDFHAAFDIGSLPQNSGAYCSYQLIRNVLAAYANDCGFCVVIDARRPDLREAWYEIVRAIRIHDLRMRCKFLTWQELARGVPRTLQQFLEEKYGIVPM